MMEVLVDRWEAYLYKMYITNGGRKAVFNVSGGTDSALALDLLCEFLTKYDIEDYTITPLHGWDTRRKHAYSPAAAQSVLDFIQNRWPSIVMKDMHVFAYYKEKHESKEKYHRPMYDYFKTEGLVDKYMIFSGGTLIPQDPAFVVNDDKAKNSRDVDSYNEMTRGSYEDSGILTSYDKEWVAQQYKERNLMDLFPKTESCVSMNLDGPGPCKKCYWCEEKYWAFGMYDGGVQ